VQGEPQVQVEKKTMPACRANIAHMAHKTYYVTYSTVKARIRQGAPKVEVEKKTLSGYTLWTMARRAEFKSAPPLGRNVFLEYVSQKHVWRVIFNTLNSPATPEWIEGKIFLRRQYWRVATFAKSGPGHVLVQNGSRPGTK